MRRKEIVDNKIKKRIENISESENIMLERLSPERFCRYLFVENYMELKFLEYIRNLCNYLLDSENNKLEVPEDIERYADSIEDSIFKELHKIDSKFLVMYYKNEIIEKGE